MKPPKIRFALVGAGVIGKVHAEAAGRAARRGRARRRVDRDPAGAELADRTAPRHRRPRRVLRRDDVDAVTICTPAACTPTAPSRPWTPASTSSSRSRSTSPSPPPTDHRREKRSGKTVAVISQHRFDRSTEKVQQAVRDGHLGTITSAIASHAWWRGQSYYDSGDWRGTWALDGGGAVMNQTVHTINLMITTLGTPSRCSPTPAASPTSASRSRTPPSPVVSSTPRAGRQPRDTAAYRGSTACLRVFGSKGSPSSPTTSWCSSTATPETRGDRMQGLAADNQSPTTTSCSRMTVPRPARTASAADIVEAIADRARTPRRHRRSPHRVVGEPRVCRSPPPPAVP
jgi:predicted dehydrogenase